MLSSDIQITELDIESLISGALKARSQSYSPYSKFRVGACLMTTDKKTFLGCNVENASYGGTICAERTAFVKAVSEGERDFLAISVASFLNSDDDCFVTPCGMCRQFMNEFSPRLPIYLVNPDGNYRIFNLEELLPHAFGPKNLESRISA